MGLTILGPVAHHGTLVSMYTRVNVLYSDFAIGLNFVRLDRFECVAVIGVIGVIWPIRARVANRQSDSR